jgi:hypothetical protein
MAWSKTKLALPVILGMLDAVLFAVAFLHGAPTWVYLVILSGWWAVVPLCKAVSDDGERPDGSLSHPS